MRENFGNVVAEAMASGRPVLVARGLAWDHLESFGAGFVFDRNEASVCEVLRKAQALDSGGVETDVSKTARQYVEQQLDPVKLGDKVWQMLKRHDQANLPQQLAEGLRMSKVGLIVPTLNAGSLWESWLKAFEQQTRKPDCLLVIDSSSSDGTEAWRAPKASMCR